MMQVSRKERATARALQEPAVSARARRYARLDFKLIPPGQVHIEIHLAPSEAAAFVYRARARKRATSNQLMALIRRTAGSAPPPRRRQNCVQPQIPMLLRKHFLAVAKYETARGGAASLRKYIVEWIDGDNGRHRRNGLGGRRKPYEWKSFAVRGRALIKAAREGVGGDKLVRYSFDAGQTKTALIRLTKVMALTLSEFFAALMEQACNDLEGLSDEAGGPRSGRRQGSDG